MTFELAAVVTTWVLTFALLQTSKSFESIVYKAGVAPPWPSRALTAGSATGMLAGTIGMMFRRSHQFYGEELIGIAIVMLVGVLSAVANRWFFQRWW